MWEATPTWKSPLDNGGSKDPPFTFDWRNRRAIGEATRKRMKRKKLWNEALSAHICFVSLRSLFSCRGIITRAGACWRTWKVKRNKPGSKERILGRFKKEEKRPVQGRVTYVFPFPSTGSLMSSPTEEGRRGGQVRAAKLSLWLTCGKGTV